MADILVTQTARKQIGALDDADAKAVDAALQIIDKITGEPIDLPGAPGGTYYLALSTRTEDGRAGPVIIYRPGLSTEDAGWVIIYLLSRDEYKEVRRAENLAATTPAVREIVSAIVSGTVGTSRVTGPPGTVYTPRSGGPASTGGTGAPPW